MIRTIGVLGYASAAALFLLLTALLLTSWRGRLQGALLAAAVATSAAWAAAAAYVAGVDGATALSYHALEVLRNAAWILFLLRLLAPLKDTAQGRGRMLGWGTPAILTFCLVLLLLETFPAALLAHLPPPLGANMRIAGHLVLAVAGLVLVEQLFRSTRPEQRWAVKYLFLGIGAMFTYDFFLYADALLFKRIDTGLWAARGFTSAVIVPLLAVSAARNPEWSLDVFVSRKVVFHTAALLGAGCYLLLMAAAGYYMRSYGGTWGTAAQAIFLFFSLVLLAALLVSGQLRARAKLFLSKHFFTHKYDYREEWLKLSRTLTSSSDGPTLRERAIRALADIVDSTGGMLWWRTEAGHFTYASHWNMNEPAKESVRADAPLVHFLGQQQRIIDLREREPEAYAGLVLPDWLRAMRRAWLVVPLIQNDALTGLVVLSEPRAPRQMNWEDHDLLKAVGMQVASHVALIEATEALMNARQFEAFNRLSSYVVHDLKNLGAQLSLVVSNAKRHKHNPAFVDDAIETVESAIQRLNRMLAQLRKGREEGKKSIVELGQVLNEAVALRSNCAPSPRLAHAQGSMSLLIERDRLVSILAHLIQNAQEATSAEGKVEVRVFEDQSDAVIEVSDDGGGMNERFIRERLFRPFDTTKGNAGMGIGAYESREFVWAQGGDLSVQSRKGAGTTFRIRLPLYRDAPRKTRKSAEAAP